MAELLKNCYNQKFVEKLCLDLLAVHSQFNSEQFTRAIFCDSWQKLELKDRMDHIAICLYQFLPSDYAQSLTILKSITPNFSGFEYMFLPRYVERYGLGQYSDSVAAMEHFTCAASAEFAVRSFILKYPEKMMVQMNEWAESDNYHLRRLASEGCRPRLPWAMALPEFKKNPEPVIEILEKLKDDESLYVRRSVANNLNDISKDNPDVVIAIAKSWFGKSDDVNWLVKHACRTLLKQGNRDVMELFGFGDLSHLKIQDFMVQESVDLGDKLAFSFCLKSSEKEIGKLRLEYAIDFMKSNGMQKRKSFQISESYCDTSSKAVNKYHSFKAISTRKHYVGAHALNIIVNGSIIANAAFELK